MIRTYWLVLAALVVSVATSSCGDAGPDDDSAATDAGDDTQTDSAATDVVTDPNPDSDGRDADGSDDTADADADIGEGVDVDAETDAADTPVRCSTPPDEAQTPIGAVPGPASAKSGIEAFEREAFERLRDHVLDDPGVFFVATLDRETSRYVVESGPVESRVRLEFERVAFDEGGGFRVVAGSLDELFGCTDPDAFQTLGALLDRFENLGFTLEHLGYSIDDPRVGTIPDSEHCYPFPLVRIASLFDAPDAPDAVATLRPWAFPAPSTHGGLGVMQSRSALMLSGAGVDRGTTHEQAALLPDVVPTVMAALGAPTVGGISATGVVADGLHVRRQDGRVLWEALADDPCDRAQHAVILLFDGLLATELNHQVLSDDPDIALPTLRAMAADGAVFLAGAVTNFPSVSAPGHMTAGTGAWAGHHGVIANAYYRREDHASISPYALIADPSYFILHPEEIDALYEHATATGFETLAEAAHRAFGDWDPTRGEGAFTAVINEVSIGGADRTTFDALGGSKAGIAEYRLADQLAVTQVEGLLRTAALPVPTTLQVSFVATDAAGESAGPHSELLRAELETAEDHVSRIRAAYDRRGALDDTLFVIVSDHGMELQDPTRASPFANLVASSGVSLSFSGTGLVYLRTLAVALSPTDTGRVLVRVTDLDDDDPVEGAVVQCDGCDAPDPSTGPDGTTVISPGGEGAVITVVADGFNPQTVTFP